MLVLGLARSFPDIWRLISHAPPTKTLGNHFTCIPSNRGDKANPAVAHGMCGADAVPYPSAGMVGTGVPLGPRIACDDMTKGPGPISWGRGSSMSRASLNNIIL